MNFILPLQANMSKMNTSPSVEEILRHWKCLTIETPESNAMFPLSTAPIDWLQIASISNADKANRDFQMWTFQDNINSNIDDRIQSTEQFVGGDRSWSSIFIENFAFHFTILRATEWLKLLSVSNVYDFVAVEVVVVVVVDVFVVVVVVVVVIAVVVVLFQPQNV